MLARLEYKEMFENTDYTGVSGNWQWGLDRGHHQRGLDLSFVVPASWNRKVRAGSVCEREVRPNYPTKTFRSYIQFGTNYVHFTVALRNQPRPQTPTQGSDRSHVQKI